MRRRGVGNLSQGRRNLLENKDRREPRWLIGWLETRPPSSPDALPDPSGTTSHTFTGGECNLASEQISPALWLLVDPGRILLKCRFSAFLTSSQVTPGMQALGPHFEQ